MKNIKLNADFAFRHLNILLIILGVAIAALSWLIVPVLQYVVGGALALFSVTITVFTLVRYRKTKVFANNIAAGIITAVAAVTVFFLGESSPYAIGVAWSIFGLFKGGREIAETINKITAKRNFVLNLLQALLTLALAVLLILDPVEHLTVHMIILGLEIIIVSTKAYKSKTSFLRTLPLEEAELNALRGESEDERNDEVKQ